MFDADFYQFIESMMAKATKRRIRKAKKVKKCIRTDCCEPQKRGRRDLCQKHYDQYDYGRRCAKKQSAAALKRYERKAIADGMVGPPHQGSSEENDYKRCANTVATT